MHGNRSRQSLDISDLDFDLSLDLDLGGRIFKIAITLSIFELGPPDFIVGSVFRRFGGINPSGFTPLASHSELVADKN